MKTKYDRSALKLEFFESKYDEVERFFQDKYKTKTDGSIRKNTKGRTKEKQDMKARIAEDAIKKSAKKQVNELSVPLEELMKGKKAIIQLLLQQVAKYMKDSRNQDGTINEIDISNAEKILRMFKTELGEPSTIGTNYNLNANKIEGLTEEESEALDILLNKGSGTKKKQ